MTSLESKALKEIEDHIRYCVKKVRKQGWRLAEGPEWKTGSTKRCCLIGAVELVHGNLEGLTEEETACVMLGIDAEDHDQIAYGYVSIEPDSSYTSSLAVMARRLRIELLEIEV